MLIGINGGYFPAIFRVCFRRQIYEAIAAIFGQSVIYFLLIAASASERAIIAPLFFLQF